MHSIKKDAKNQLLEVYKGVKIRKVNRIVIQAGVVQYKKLIDEAETSGMSILKILAHSGKPCEKCKGVDVIVYNEKGEQKKIKRGILSVPENNGCSLLGHTHNKRLVRDTSSGEIYPNASQVAKAFNLNYDTLLKSLKGQITNYTHFEYIENAESHRISGTDKKRA